MQKKYNLPDDFELSQPYLFFWDKLEKCNFLLENIISTANEPIESRLVQHLLTDPTSDGIHANNELDLKLIPINCASIRRAMGNVCEYHQ